MTFEEAKKILEKEGFYLMKFGGPSDIIDDPFSEYESPEIYEAMDVVNSAGYGVGMHSEVSNERKARLKKEHEKHVNASDKMGMTLEEAKDILKKEFAVVGLHKSTEPFEFDESRWFENEKPSVLEAFRVLAKGGYYISIIGHDYNMREKRLKKEYEENTKAPDSGEEQSEEKKGIIYPTTFPKADFYYKHVLNEGNPALKESATQFNDALLDEQAKKIERLKEKNLRLGREIARLNKNIYKKNMKIEELRKESSRHLRGKIKMFCENVDLEQMLKDKDAVLSDVAEELRLSKIREKNLTEVSLKYIKENEELKKKLAAKIVDKIDAQALKSAESALAYKEKEIAEKDEVIADLGKELAEAKKLNTAKILDINAKCMRAARESINDVFESYAAKYAKSTLDDLKEKAYESFNAKACNLGLVGSKDGNGIIDQMIGVDIAEEGADLSGVFVLCGKDFIDALKKVKDVWQE